MAPDAVQYARALRPPYHLLSFLRIKGYSTKGMSCTDKNTMVSELGIAPHKFCTTNIRSFVNHKNLIYEMLTKKDPSRECLSCIFSVSCC